MGSRIRKVNVPFAQVPNELLTDGSVTLKAKGLWAYMQSKPDGWKFSALRIANEIKEGRDAILNGFNELIEHGWLSREKQTDGSIVYSMMLPESKNPDPENPTVGKPGPISNKDKVSNKEKETPIVPLPEDFKVFWNQYGKKVSRDKCFKLWKKLSNRDKTEIFVVLPDYVASTPEIKYRKNPETWLRNRGWEDQIIPQKPKVDSNGPVGRFS